MTTSLAVALIGDLILLPCLLYLRPRSRKAPRRAGDQPQTDQQPLNDRETLFETSAAETIDESAARLPPRRPHVMRPKKQAPFVPGNSDIE